MRRTATVRAAAPIAWMVLCVAVYMAIADAPPQPAAAATPAGPAPGAISEATPLTLSLFIAGIGGAVAITWFVAGQRAAVDKQVNAKLEAHAEAVAKAIAAAIDRVLQEQRRHEARDCRRARHIYRAVRTLHQTRRAG